MDKAAELAKSYKTSGESDRPDKYTEACGRENMQFQQLWVDPGDFSPCNKGGCTPPEAVQDRNHFRHGCHLNFSCGKNPNQGAKDRKSTRLNSSHVANPY